MIKNALNSLFAILVIASLTVLAFVVIENQQQEQQSANANRIESKSTSTVCISGKPCVTTICVNNQPCRTFTANSTNTRNSTNSGDNPVLPPQQTF
jgi:hypothetical protein